MYALTVSWATENMPIHGLFGLKQLYIFEIDCLFINYGIFNHVKINSFVRAVFQV